MQVQGQCHVCSLGDNNCISLRQWNAHVGILPIWSWSCKTPSIGLMFESPCQTIVYGHVSGSGRGHSFWQQKTSFLLTGGFTEGGQAACFGSASSRRTGVLGPDCGNLDQLTREFLNRHVLNNILPQCRSTDIRPCLMWRMSARPLGFPSVLGMIKSCFPTYL